MNSGNSSKSYSLNFFEPILRDFPTAELSLQVTQCGLEANCDYLYLDVGEGYKKLSDGCTGSYPIKPGTRNIRLYFQTDGSQTRSGLKAHTTFRIP